MAARSIRKKRWLERWPVLPILVWLIVKTVRLYPRLCRFQRIVPEATEPYMRGERNAIFAFWHGRMTMMPLFCPPGRKMHVMISRHGDGEALTKVMAGFDFGTLRGSRRKGGHAAAIKALAVLKAGDNISITPDGPRGPYQLAAPGTGGISRLSGMPVIPVTFSAKRYKRLGSWDRFMIALPFTEIVFIAGEPMYLSEDSDDDAARAQVEIDLNRITTRADRFWDAA